ncbi:hypothetical protein CPSG_04039 [Coccidioides posadasii str. Silveira]|uniref:Uncharacterized protein n=1 Tax=Coccidioides posadasii (strain RMSCC 757 / Silveira) TaxID=443226 RepID=E9D1I1_COCPS|nr:hypothetical protein CPSG_04039 [Coccidioides posadasii str. Silveira]
MAFALHRQDRQVYVDNHESYTSSTLFRDFNPFSRYQNGELRRPQGSRDHCALLCRFVPHRTLSAQGLGTMKKEEDYWPHWAMFDCLRWSGFDFPARYIRIFLSTEPLNSNISINTDLGLFDKGPWSDSGI